MPKFTGRVVDKESRPIKDAKISFEDEETPSVDHTDAEGIFSFSVDTATTTIIDIKIKVEAKGYKLYNRNIKFAVNNKKLTEIRLIEDDIVEYTGLPVPILIAIIGATSAVLVALISNPGILNQKSASEPSERIKPNLNEGLELHLNQDCRNQRPNTNTEAITRKEDPSTWYCRVYLTSDRSKFIDYKIDMNAACERAYPGTFAYPMNIGRSDMWRCYKKL